MGVVGSCITASRRNEGLGASSQYRWFSYNETVGGDYGSASAHERAYGGVHRVPQACSLFSLTVDSVLAFCLR